MKRGKWRDSSKSWPHELWSEGLLTSQLSVALSEVDQEEEEEEEKNHPAVYYWEAEECERDNRAPNCETEMCEIGGRLQLIVACVRIYER